MLRTYASFMYRHARLALVATGLAVVVAVLIGSGVFGKLVNGGFDDPKSQSSQAQQLVDAHFGGENNLVLLVHAKSGTVDADAVRAAGTELADGLAGEDTVRNVVSYWGTGAPGMKSTDGRDALIVGHVTGNDNEVGDRAAALVDRYTSDRYTGDQAAISVKPGGDAVANNDLTKEVGSSLALAEAIAVPLTLLLLVLVFGSVVAAFLPLIVGGVAIAGTFAELFILGSVTDVSVFAINLTTALGLGLGIDYALLAVSRFREQLASGASVEDAVIRTVQTAGRTILFSAASVAAALAAMLVFPLFFLRSFAYAGIGVVVIAAVAALVVIPAMLSVLGHRVNAGRLPWSKAVRGADSPMWGRIAAGVMRRPALIALPVVAVLLLMASPLLHVSFGTPDSGVLPSSASSRQVADTLTERFPGDGTATMDIVTTGPVEAGALAGYASKLSEVPGVARVETSAGTFTGGTAGPATPAAKALSRPEAQRLTVSTTVESKSDAAQELVQTVRDVAAPTGAQALVGGTDARLVDTKDAIGSRLPIAGVMIVLTTFVLLFLFTGSVVQPIRALALNALSLSATLGAMVWIFSEGHFSSFLNFTARPMDTAMTVLLFCITFGLSMDYEVFLVSRIKELHDKGERTASAVTQGLARTGRIVSSAAALLAVTFFAFGTSSVSFLQLFGLGSGLAILIDATLVRGVLVPAVMRLVDRRIWYSPKMLRRVYARVALSEA